METKKVYIILEGIWEDKYPLNKVFTTYEKAQNYINTLVQEHINEYNKIATHRRAIIKNTGNITEIRHIKVDNFKDGLVDNIPYNAYEIINATLE